ncbi:hypothetical protein [Desulfosporosinus youngiae]|uniref:ABC-type multidrug transport system, ATPase component n=1 Tax=Desulfosporosinus youngiae DSM 17734 TaxID=768710 RepID=H5Y3P9_9FIRM|nr:hypothetical protein [Desulfosporosinus youngiae]EHQ89293.1 ABC-type multidrug transport system, ATPase component [Desulfosporosinus youngiae DSM 17734]
MEHNPEQVVLMEGVSSAERFLLPKEISRRVLDEITLVVKRAEAWGITGKSLLELKLLLEIMANIRPYDKGKCVLVERGMMRRKRVILKHVFYIGNSDMLYNNMNVLEFLMFATAKYKMNKVLLQEEIFELIIDIGLGHLSLTPNHRLTKEEKAVITLIAAAYSNSLIIVFNLPEYQWDEVLVEAVAELCRFIRERGKSIILATQNCGLIEKACSHTAIIKDGKLIYDGTVEDFRLKFDKVEVIIRDKSARLMAEKLVELLPAYELGIKGDSLLISNKGLQGSDPGTIYKNILESGFTPDSMEINPKTVQNAYEELMRQHDL